MNHFLIHKCNFCNSNNIRLDVFKTILHSHRPYGSQRFYWQAFSTCSNCKNGMILRLEANLDKIGDDFSLNYQDKESFVKKQDLCKFEKTNINDHVKINGIISPPLKQLHICPTYVPDNIKNIFDEATKCLSINCYVASGSMFRLCLDLVTKDLLEKWLKENTTSEIQPNKNQKEKLAYRIDFLIDQKIISRRLEELAHSIRHDGNDSAHDGNTGEDEALDCLDFTEALLTEVYTLPEQINEANKRRLERRTKSSN